MHVKVAKQFSANYYKAVSLKPLSCNLKKKPANPFYSITKYFKIICLDNQVLIVGLLVCFLLFAIKLDYGS